LTVNKMPVDYSGCGQVDTASHEYAEAATDPFGDGWTDSAAPSQEIGDLCEGLSPANGLSQLWSNDGSVGHCATSFTARYTYQLGTIRTPQGEPNGTYARGHAYDGGQITARNTGNMPWFPIGPNATYLGT